LKMVDYCWHLRVKTRNQMRFKERERQRWAYTWKGGTLNGSLQPQNLNHKVIRITCLWNMAVLKTFQLPSNESLKMLNQQNILLTTFHQSICVLSCFFKTCNVIWAKTWTKIMDSYEFITTQCMEHYFLI